MPLDIQGYPGDDPAQNYLSSDVSFDVQGLGTIYATPEVTRKEVGDVFNFLLNPLVDILEAKDVSSVSTLTSSTYDGGSVVTRPIGEALALSLQGLASLAQNGMALPSIQDDPSSNQETYHITIEMSRQLDLLLRALKSSGLDLQAALGGTNVAAGVIENFKNATYTTSSIREILSSAQLAATDHNRSLQAFLELVYVRTGNELMNDKLSDLEQQLTTTKQALDTFKELQDIHNKLSIKSKGDLIDFLRNQPEGNSNTGLTGDPKIDIELIHKYSGDLIPGVSKELQTTTTQFFDDLTQEFPILENLQSQAAALGAIPDDNVPLSPTHVIQVAPAISFNQSSPFYQTDIDVYNHVLNIFGLPNVSAMPQIITSPSQWNPGSILDYETKLTQARDYLLAQPSEHSIGVTTYQNKGKTLGFSLLQNALMPVHSDYGFYLNNREITDLPSNVQTLYTEYNNAIVEINTNRLPDLNKMRAKAGLLPVPSLPQITHPISIPYIGTDILFHLEPITAEARLKSFDLSTYDDDTLLTKQNEANLLLVRLYKAKQQLEKVRDLLMQQTGTDAQNKSTSLLSRVEVILADLNKISSGVPTDENVTAMYSWILDNYGSEDPTLPGNIQDNLTFGITAAQSSNDTQKEEVRRFLFLFEEYYKSASAILTKITQILERMAQGISR